MEDSSFDGLSSLVRLSGVHVPARARFVGEAMLSAAFSSITVGLVCGQVGALSMAAGPLVPFLVGSWAGFSMGLVSYWRGSVKWSDTVAKTYPSLMIHALKTQKSYPLEETPANVNDGESLEQWMKDGGLGRLSVCVLAAQECRHAVETIVQNQCNHLVENYQQMDTEGESY